MDVARHDPLANLLEVLAILIVPHAVADGAVGLDVPAVVDAVSGHHLAIAAVIGNAVAVIAGFLHRGEHLGVVRDGLGQTQAGDAVLVGPADFLHDVIADIHAAVLRGGLLQLGELNDAAVRGGGHLIGQVGSGDALEVIRGILLEVIGQVNGNAVVHQRGSAARGLEVSVDLDDVRKLVAHQQKVELLGLSAGRGVNPFDLNANVLGDLLPADVIVVRGLVGRSAQAMPPGDRGRLLDRIRDLRHRGEAGEYHCGENEEGQEFLHLH